MDIPVGDFFFLRFFLVAMYFGTKNTHTSKNTFLEVRKVGIGTKILAGCGVLQRIRDFTFPQVCHHVEVSADHHQLGEGRNGGSFFWNCWGYLGDFVNIVLGKVVTPPEYGWSAYASVLYIH